MKNGTDYIGIKLVADKQTLRVAEKIFNKIFSEKNKIKSTNIESYEDNYQKLSKIHYFKKVINGNIRKTFFDSNSKNFSKTFLKNYHKIYLLFISTYLYELKLKSQIKLSKSKNIEVLLFTRLFYGSILKFKSINKKIKELRKNLRIQKNLFSSHYLNDLLINTKSSLSSSFKNFYYKSWKNNFKSNKKFIKSLNLIDFFNALTIFEINLVLFSKNFFAFLTNQYKFFRNNYLLVVIKKIEKVISPIIKKLTQTYISRKFSSLINTLNQLKLNCLLMMKKIFTKKQLSAYLNRLGLVTSVYGLPFVFLATQALIPLNQEYQYLIVNPLSSRIFKNIPFLVNLIQFSLPLTTNAKFLLWIPLGYYITFTSAYRSLKIPYKIAYNGTIASIFLILNYSSIAIQYSMNLVFESIQIIKDLVFTSYLIKHLSKHKKKGRAQAVKIFADLANRYDSETARNYYPFLLFANHRIFSHLALITLAALLYNCIYYIIHNKNPEIILVTKAALASIKNPQEEE